MKHHQEVLKSRKQTSAEELLIIFDSECYFTATQCDIPSLIRNSLCSSNILLNYMGKTGP